MIFNTISLGTSLTLITAAHATVHSINVAKEGLEFVPNTLTASVGDLLEFHFFSGNNSVASSTFTNPCVPAKDAFFSGYIKGDSTGDVTFIVTVMNTDSIWFYSTMPGLCHFGMAGVVNPPSGTSVQNYWSAAASVFTESAPATKQGGVLTTIPTSAVSASTAITTSAGGSATTTMPSSGGSPSPTATGNGSSSPTATETGTSTTGGAVVTTKASVAGRLGGISVMLGLGVFAAGLVAIMA